MTSTVRRQNPSALNEPPGYSHVVEVTGPGRTIYVSGQVGYDRHGAVVGAGDFRAQATQVFRNLEAALAAAGTDFAHVVKVNTYLTDLSHRATLREVRSQFLDKDALPASTLVGVSELAHPDIELEVEMVAFVPDRG